MASPDFNSSTGASSTDASDRGVIDRVKDRAAAQLSTQKDKATDGLGSVAQFVRQGTQQLRDQQHETLAGYVEQAADQIDRFSQQLRNKDVSELFNDAQRLARRNPAVFIGSAFAIGLVGARFFKSSPPDSEYSSPGRGNGGMYSGGGTYSGGGAPRSYPSAANYSSATGSNPAGEAYTSESNIGSTGAASEAGSSTPASTSTRTSTPRRRSTSNERA